MLGRVGQVADQGRGRAERAVGLDVGHHDLGRERQVDLVSANRDAVEAEHARGDHARGPVGLAVAVGVF
ncbi:hypothetical protein D3C72_2354220 [compost metagenome]